LQPERPCLHHIFYRSSMYGEDFGADDAELVHWRRLQRVSIGHDVWLGHCFIIMRGVKIGHDAVIGSGTGSSIEAVAWWDWTHEELQARQDELKDVRRMLAAHERRKVAGLRRDLAGELRLGLPGEERMFAGRGVWKRWVGEWVAGSSCSNRKYERRLPAINGH
jgi:hypothetical protein